MDIRNSLFDIGHSLKSRVITVGSAVQTVGEGVEFVDMFCSLSESQFGQKLITKHTTWPSNRGLHSRPYGAWEIVRWALPTTAVVLRGIAKKRVQKKRVIMF